MRPGSRPRRALQRRDLILREGSVGETEVVLRTQLVGGLEEGRLLGGHNAHDEVRAEVAQLLGNRRQIGGARWYDDIADVFRAERGHGSFERVGDELVDAPSSRTRATFS